MRKRKGHKERKHTRGGVNMIEEKEERRGGGIKKRRYMIRKCRKRRIGNREETRGGTKERKRGEETRREGAVSPVNRIKRLEATPVNLWSTW